MWQTASVSSYRRNGLILNGALCGLDEALWDIKAKRANMPRYELSGGKSRFAIATYCHAYGKTVEETSNNVSKFRELGWKHVRIQRSSGMERSGLLLQEVSQPRLERGLARAFGGRLPCISPDA